MNSEQAIFELEVFGFTVLPSVLETTAAARLGELLDAADQAIGTEYVYDGANARLVPCVPAIAQDFLPLIDHPTVMPVIEAVLGRDIVLGSMNSRIVRPGDPAQGLHSDIPTVHRRIIGPPVMLQIAWMIDGFTLENGATRLVPGSHRAPEPAPPEDRIVPYIVEPTGPSGSVLIFNGQCWHGGGANRSEQRRRAVFGHYRVGPWMRFQLDPAQYVSVERWEQMSPRQREILRMTHGPSQKNAADYYPEQAVGRRYD
ncbi:phytanoyl-CoA dioxygenase family protein [Phenylobacterium sp. LjRoot219]|uniref:phytanoyl-CoA dioxygenase family protein n=1 Tax=Phenylobacterium sp. LjRoot219 TaxID=3342283 RepID=UPI003ECF4430